MQLKTFRCFLLPALAIASLQAQTPTPPKVTVVMATLTLKDGVTRDQMKKVMPTEVRETVDLYLDGKIREWYARGDGRGVVFIVDCKTVDEAKAILEQLPLVKSSYASFDYMALGPLSPLKLLLTPAPRQ
jgi:muconolactone delta-isomerase